MSVSDPRHSVQPFFNKMNHRRRFLETFSPALNGRLFIKRLTTVEEAERKRNAIGAPESGRGRSFTSLQNEASALLYVQKNTTIPVPRIYARFEDRGYFYLILEYIENAIPAAVSHPNLHPHITRQLEGHMGQLHSLVGPILRSFTSTGLPHFSARLRATRAYLSHLKYPEDPLNRYVLCHGDLGWQNVLVDPVTGDIRSIIDWEYAGFYPVEVEGQYWRGWESAEWRGFEPNDMDDICRLLNNLSTKGAFEPDYLAPWQRPAETTKHSLGGQVERKQNAGASGTLLRIFNLRKHRRPRSYKANRSKKGTGSSKIESTASQNAGPAAPLEHSSPAADPPDKRIDPQSSPSHMEETVIEPLSVAGNPDWQQLDAALIPDEDLSSCSLSLQAGISARRAVAQQADKLKSAILIDQHALKDWLTSQAAEAPPFQMEQSRLKPDSLANETRHLVELYKLLGTTLSGLGERLSESTSPLELFQSQQNTVKRLNLRHIEQQRQNRAPTSASEAANYNTLNRQARAATEKAPANRDQAFRDSETLKWNAIRKALENALIVTHAAETLLSFTPDRIRFQPSRFFDPTRKKAEDRARDLILGGNGGYKVLVQDIENYSLLDPKDLGVPEPIQREGDTNDVPEGVLELLMEKDKEYRSVGDQYS
ncbi:hypothetical protein IAT40_003997 [Kwoniella sp. CBS 6097]